MKRVYKITKEKIEKYLAEIDWSLQSYGCEHYRFYNHKGKPTDWTFFSDRVEIEQMGEYDKPMACFYLKDCNMDLLGDYNKTGNYDCVSFVGKKNKSIFILMQNFDKKKKTKPSS